MAIETFGGSGVVVTGPDIQTYRLLAIRQALKMQAEIGLKSNRFNVAQQARDILTAANYNAPRNIKKLFLAYNKFLVDKGLIQR